MPETRTSDYQAARVFARAAQAATWLLASGWAAIVVMASGLIGGDQPLAARLPDVAATAAFVGLVVVAAAVVHAVLEAAIAVYRIADGARSLPEIEKQTRMNVQLANLPPVEVAAPPARIEVARPIARPVDPALVRRAATT